VCRNGECLSWYRRVGGGWQRWKCVDRWGDREWTLEMGERSGSCGSQNLVAVREERGVYIATLWEMIVFSVSSKLWSSVGLSTFCSPEVGVKPDIPVLNWAARVRDTYACSRLCSQPTQQQGQRHREANPSLQSSSRRQ
jgi:hypothetical protein